STSGDLTWVTRLFDTSSTVTGMDSPSSVKIRVMPTLRPTSPSRCAAGVGVGFDIVFSIPDYDWSGLIKLRALSPSTTNNHSQGFARFAYKEHRPNCWLARSW